MLTPGEAASSATREDISCSGADVDAATSGSGIGISDETGAATGAAGYGALKLAVMAPLRVVTSALSVTFVR